MLRSVALGAALIAFAASVNSAGATDFGAVPPPAADDWSGLYIGGHAGYGWGRWDGTLIYDDGTGPVPGVWDPANRTISGAGGLGGAQIGFNKQTDSLVWGLEADASWAGIGGSDTFFTIPGPPPAGVGWEISNKLDVFGTVRGRLGVTSGKLLIYGTGGVALARTSANLIVHQTFPPDDITAIGSAKENHIGWVAGGGFEWMFASNWSLKTEYLFADLGKADYRLTGTAYPGTAPCVGPPAPGCSSPHTTDSFPARLLLQTVRVGVNYHFD